MGPFGAPPEKGVYHDDPHHTRRHLAARMRKEKHYSNYRVSALIDEYIHSARNREILRDKLVDDLSYDELAGKYGLSYDRVKTIVREGREEVFANY